MSSIPSSEWEILMSAPGADSTSIHCSSESFGLLELDTWQWDNEGLPFPTGSSSDVGSSPDDFVSQLHPNVSLSWELVGNDAEAYQPPNAGTSSHYSSPTEQAATGSAPPQPIQHEWIQTSEVTTTKALSHLVHEISVDGVKSFYCAWPGCQHIAGFTQKPQLITHIRSTHLQQKPFLCTTCNTPFARKQDAGRHVDAMNRGKQYKCNVCQRAFTRRHYRDAHQEGCPRRATSQEYAIDLCIGQSQGSSPRI